MRPFAVLALAACGGAQSASREPAAPPYLALFERGRGWSLPIEIVHGQQRGEVFAATATQRATVSCSVAEVKQIADANAARLACAPPYDGLLVAGWWIATPAGLYHPALPIDDPDELALLGEEDLLLTAKPKEREHSAAASGIQHTIEAFRHQGSWCVRDSVVTEEDRRHYTLCFGATGITGGGDLVVSGSDRSWHRTTFGAVADDPDDPTAAHSD